MAAPLRGLIGLPLAACIFVAVIALQSSYGDALKPIIARGAPQLVPTSSQLLGKTGACHTAEHTERSGGHGGASTSATSTSGSDRTARRRADGRARACRAGTVGPDDNARSRKRRANDRTAQDQPGTNGPRQCEGRRARSRRAKNRWPASLPRLPDRTRGPRHQRLRHGRLAPGREPTRTLPSPQVTARPQAALQPQAEKL